MKNFQKIIKYAAIAFGLYLAVMIIGAIVGGVLAICTGIYAGTSIKNEQSNIQTIDETKEFEEFSKLDLEIGASNLTIKSEGEEFKVETYQIPETTKIENKNGILTIKITKKNWFSYNYDESNIIVYIPEGKELDEIKLEMGAGTVKIENIKSTKVDFSFGAGAVNIKNLTSENAKIECGAGEVVIEDTDLTDAKLDSGVGKLVYSGYMRGTSKIDCGVGEVVLNLKGGNEIYKIDTEKGIGDIKINGNSVANKTVTGNGENRISIDGGIGSISVNFE